MNTLNTTIIATHASGIVTTQSDNSTQGTGPMLSLMTDTKACALLTQAGDRYIRKNWRNPARAFAVNIPSDAWAPLATVPEAFRGLLDTVLVNAAETIIKRYVENYTLPPTHIPAALFTADAIMLEAAGNNSTSYTREELTAAWEASATRKEFISRPQYASSKEYRTTVSWFADLIKKLAGRTAGYTPEELDIMVAKLNESDHETEFGQYVVRRVEALRNRKAPDSAINMNLL